MELAAPTLTGRWVRLELLAPEHRDELRIAADDDRIWEYMTSSAAARGSEEWFDNESPDSNKPLGRGCRSSSAD